MKNAKNRLKNICKKREKIEQKKLHIFAKQKKP